MSQHSDDQLNRDASQSGTFSDWKVYVIVISVAAALLAVALLCCCRRHRNMKTLLNGTAATLNAEIRQLSQKLEIMEDGRAENKRRLQSVEMEITEKERMFEKPEELLREKENLLKAEWSFDREKEIWEREILNREKLLEPIENQLSRQC